MNTHLTELDIENLLQKGESTLSKEHIQHLKSCESCQKLYQDQYHTDKILWKVLPIQAPETLQNQILEIIEEQKLAANNFRKKDWFFILSMGMLIITLFVVILQYPLPEFLTVPLTGVTSLLAKAVEPLTKVFTDIKTPFSGYNNTILQLPSGYLFLFIGIISILFYFVVDSILFKQISKKL